MRKGEGRHEGIQGEVNPNKVQTSIVTTETEPWQDEKIVALRGDNLDVCERKPGGHQHNGCGVGEWKMRQQRPERILGRQRQ